MVVGGPPTEEIVPNNPLNIDAKNKFFELKSGAMFVTERVTDARITQ